MGGIPEAIEDGVNGLLLPPGDMDAWVMAMRRVATDRNLVAQFHQAQLTCHVKTMEEHASELTVLYSQLQMSDSENKRVMGWLDNQGGVGERLLERDS
jgi:glycosyltransferase involved in cell wall biosynthesis